LKQAENKQVVLEAGHNTCEMLNGHNKLAKSSSWSVSTTCAACCIRHVGGRQHDINLYLVGLHFFFLAQKRGMLITFLLMMSHGDLRAQIIAWQLSLHTSRKEVVPCTALSSALLLEAIGRGLKLCLSCLIRGGPASVPERICVARTSSNLLLLPAAYY